MERPPRGADLGDPLLIRTAPERPLVAVHRRRRLLTVAVLSLVLAGVLGLALAARSGRPTADGGGPLPAAPAVDETVVTATANGVGAAEGLQVTVATARQALVGTRISAAVTVRNTGSTTFHWQAGGCAIPTEVVLVARGADVDATGTLFAPPRTSAEPRWDGSDGALAAALDDSVRGPIPQGATPADQAGSGGFGCTADSRMAPLEPGETVEHTGVFELRAPPGELADGGAYEVVARFIGFAAAEDYPRDELPPVAARVPVEVVDDPARAVASVDDVADVIVADGRAASWLATTVIPARPDLDQRALAGLTWWRRGWELWVAPRYGGGDSARVRVDPQTMAVVDARVVSSGAAPEDEPGGVRFPSTPPDVLLPPLDGTGGDAVTGATAEPSSARVGDTVTVAVGAGASDVCGGLVIVYEETAGGTVERGALIGVPGGAPTWVSAPQGSPMTIPPCLPDPAVTTVRFTVPALAPGTYTICLTRASGSCAPLQVVP